MRQTVVVPLDGSKLGEAALLYVRELFAKLAPGIEKHVILVHVVRPVHPMVSEWNAAAGWQDLSGFEKEAEENREKALDYLRRTKDALECEGCSVTVETPVGDTPDEIVRTAEESEADLIAMSTHGRSGIGRWAFGSITDRVLRSEGKTPIVVVRPDKGD